MVATKIGYESVGKHVVLSKMGERDGNDPGNGVIAGSVFMAADVVAVVAVLAVSLVELVVAGLVVRMEGRRPISGCMAVSSSAGSVVGRRGMGCQGSGAVVGSRVLDDDGISVVAG